MIKLFACLLIAFGIQYACFRQYVEREIAWAYPANYDQVFYLSDAYTAYDQTLQQGVLTGTAHHFAERRPTGWLMPVEAALGFHFLGASRLSALTVHFAHLILFEAVLAVTLYWYAGNSVWIALIGVGLFLCSLSRLLPSGGLTDFRMESSAQSLFGIVLCLVIRSNVFLSRRWSVAVGGAAGFLICLRYITVVYLTGIFVILLAVAVWRSRSRLPGLLIAAGVAMAIALPVLLYNQESIRGYYLPSHLVGNEKQVRAAEIGIQTWLDGLTYYPKVLILRHLAFLTFPVAAFLVAAVPLLLGRRRNPIHRWTLLTAALFILVPLLVLTSDTTKVEPVAGVMIPGVLWLLLLPIASRVPPRWALAGLLTAVAAGWLAREVPWSRSSSLLFPDRAKVETVVRLNAQLGRLATAQGLATPLITINEMADYLSPDMLTVLAYEQTSKLIKPRSALWMGVMAVPKANALDAVLRSDFAILATYPGPVAPPQYPFNVAMKEYAPDVLALARQQMKLVGEYQLEGQPVQLYSRR